MVSAAFLNVGSSFFCPLSFSCLIATNTAGFNVNWMLHQIYLEIYSAQQSFALIRNATGVFDST